MVCPMASCGSFSRSRTPSHGSSPAPDCVITSRMCCVSCTGFLSSDEMTTRLYAWCISCCLVCHWHIWLMMSTLLPTVATIYSDQHSAADRTCVVPRTHNTFDDRSFAAAGPRVWNSLLFQLRQDLSYGQFKRQLKTFLFLINWPQRIMTVWLFGP